MRRGNAIRVLLGLLPAFVAAAAAAAPPAPGAVALERRAVATYDDYLVDVAAGDLDGDGLPDLVASDSRGRVRVLHNAGRGRFELGSTHPIPSGLEQLVVADLDRDGDRDVAVAGEGNQGYPDSSRSSGGAWVIRNDGAGKFGQPVLHPTGRASQSIAVGDLNEDGWPDLALANGVAGSPPPGSAVSVLIGTGDGGFEPPREPTPLQLSSALALADMNMDGHVDLLGGGLEVFPGRGDGTFGEPARTRLGELWAIEVADLDADGRPDVVAGTYAEKTDIAVMRGLPTGLGPPSRRRIGDWAGAATSGGLVVGAFDSRPGADLAFADLEGLYLASGDARGDFGAAVRYPFAEGGLPALAGADLDRDGRLDLAQVDNSGRIEVFLNRGEGPRAALSLPRARPFRIAEDRSVHVPLACGRGVGRCAGELTLTAGGRRLGSIPVDLAPRAREAVRVVAPAARAGRRVRIAVRTDLGTRSRDAAIAGPTRGQRRAACSPSASATLARSAAARVFTFEEGFGPTIGCLYSVGAWTEMPAEYPDGPFRTSGRYAAFVGRELCDPETCLVAMHVFDLRARRYVTVDTTSTGPCEDESDCGLAVTGRLVIGPRGTVAWTTCTDGERCERKPDSAVAVYRIDRRGLRRVAQARDVDPYSLRIERGGIVWRQGGATRRASLLGTPPTGFACEADFAPRRPAACPRR